ncbi:MAG: hypothetical protein M3433_01100 [Actinomycetota bacterium]|nr:hypothetical protein [Actinomycetota bacterium]
MRASDLRPARPVRPNEAYERGWREGWAAALGNVQERGLEVVLAAEKRLDAPLPMTLAFEEDREQVS